MSDSSSDSPKKASFRWLRYVKVVGMVLLLGLVLQRVDWAVVQRSWKPPSVGVTLLVCALVLCSMTVRIVKWGWQAKWSGFSFRWRGLAQSYLSGLLVGFLTPLRLGEVARVTALRLPDSSPVSRPALTAAALFLEKLYELAVLALMVACGLGLAFGLWKSAALVGAGGLFLCVLLLVPLTLPERWILVFPAFVQRFVLRPFVQAKGSLSSLRLSWLMALTLLSHALNLTAGWFVFQMFGKVGFLDFVTRIPILTLINNIPVTIGGVGIRELGAMQLFTSTGFTPSAAAVSASLLFVMINLFPTLAWLPLEMWPSSDPGEDDAGDGQGGPSFV